MSTALTAAARAEICKVLKWFKAHPGGNRKDMPEELFDVYKQWQKLLIHGDSFFGYPPLVDDSKTMLTFPGLSEFGRRLLEQWDTGPEADTSRDRSGADR